MATAVMYVMQKVFCLDDKYLIVKADERLGRFLLNEIMLSGNFGFYDKRIDKYRGSQLKRTYRDLCATHASCSSSPARAYGSPSSGSIISLENGCQILDNAATDMHQQLHGVPRR